MQSRTNEILGNLQKKIDSLHAEKESRVDEIRSKEQNLITKTNQSPQQWNNAQLKSMFDNVEFSSNIQEIDDLFSSMNRWETIGKINKIKPNYKVSFEVKINELPYRKNFFYLLKIGDWFTVSFKWVDTNGKPYNFIKLKQMNGLGLNEFINAENPIELGRRWYTKETFTG